MATSRRSVAGFCVLALTWNEYDSFPFSYIVDFGLLTESPMCFVTEVGAFDIPINYFPSRCTEKKVLVKCIKWRQLWMYKPIWIKSVQQFHKILNKNSNIACIINQLFLLYEQLEQKIHYNCNEFKHFIAVFVCCVSILNNEIHWMNDGAQVAFCLWSGSVTQCRFYWGLSIYLS